MRTLVWLICALFVNVSFIYGQSRLFFGQVRDIEGNAIRHVTVKNLSNGVNAQSLVDGDFKISGNPGDSLGLYLIGYDALFHILPASRDTMYLLLTKRSHSIEEVTISTGYQDIDMQKMTGSVFKVDSALLNRSVGSNILQRLKDVVPGMSFNARHPNITIRGVNTIHGDTSPLIVVDNFPYDGDINTINPSDIESISILKDAAAAAIWGTRAGNGVIVITTKRGRSNQVPNISIESNISIGGKRDLFYTPVMTVSDYIDTEKRLFEEKAYEATEQNLNRLPLSEAVELFIAKRDNKIDEQEYSRILSRLGKQDVRQDIRDYLHRNSFSSRTAASIRGGSKNHNYVLSSGYDQDITNVMGISNDRLTLRSRQEFNFLADRLSVYADIFYIKRKDILDGQAIYTGMSPYERLVDERGEPTAVHGYYRRQWLDQAPSLGLLDWHYRPLDELENSNNRKETKTFQINTGASYKLWDGLKLNLLYQYIGGEGADRNLYGEERYFTRDLVNRFTQLSANGEALYPIPKTGILDLQSNVSRTNSLRSFLQYNKLWKDHSWNVIAGWEMRDSKSMGNSSRLYGYDDKYAVSSLVDYYTSYAMSYYTRKTEKIPYKQSMYEQVKRDLSYYFNLVYNYQNRIGLSASIRKDQSNVFGVSANLRGIPLYSVGMLWNIGNESFWPADRLGYLQLKGSFGYNGNMDNTLSSQITAKYLAGNAFYLPRAEIVNPPNNRLRWERIQVLNAAMRWDNLNKDFGVSFEYYIKKGLDLIGDSPYATSSGIESFRGNTANTKGKGFELLVDRNHFNGSFKWNSVFLFSYASDKVTNYLLAPFSFSNVIESGTSAYPIEGVPRYSVFSYKWAGLNPENGNPRGYLSGVVSEDYSKIIADASFDNTVFHGSVLAPYYGSLRNTVSWNNLELSTNISFRMGHYVRLQSISYGVNYGLGGHGDIYERWQTAGDDLKTQVPSMPLKGGNAFRDRLYTYSSELVERADVIRWNDLRVGYTIPMGKQGLLKNVKRMQTYAFMSNLGRVWTRNSKKVDPENLSQPLIFQLSFGIKIEL